MSVKSTLLSASICSKPKNFVLDAIKKLNVGVLNNYSDIFCKFFFCQNWFFGAFFRENTFIFEPFIFGVLLVKRGKILLKVRKSNFLIKKWGCWFYRLFSFSSLYLSDHVLDIWFFTYFFYCKKRIFFLLFPVVLDVSFVTIIFIFFKLLSTHN